jgi:hypothetical protein
MGKEKPVGEEGFSPFVQEDRWMVVHESGERQYVTWKEVYTYLRKHRDLTFTWMGKVRVIIVHRA